MTYERPSNQPDTNVPDAARILVFVVVAVFVAHLGLELLFSARIIALPGTNRIVLESVLLVLLIFPAMYLLVHRPFMVEITKHQRMEEALHETTQRLQALVEASPLAINVLDRDGKVVMWNPACERIFGWSVKEALGRTNPIVQEDERGEFHRLMREIQRGKTFSNLEVKRQKKDGSPIDISLSVAPLFDANDSVVASLGMIADITEHKRLEKFREGYVYTISHDLRNPLGAIQGLAQYLLRRLEKAGSNDSEWQSAQGIITSADRMNAIIQDLLDSARLETGRIQIEREPVAVDLFVSDVLKRVPALGGREVRVDIPAGLPSVPADPSRLERVLTNLLANAAKYSYPDTEIVVGVKRAGTEMTVFVEDRGPEIAPEDLPHIFDRFYRGAGVSRTEGLGLGLDIAKGLVEAHGGRIWAESEVGRSIFYFTLPLAQ